MINITNSITIIILINNENQDDKMNEKDKDNIIIINCINKNL